MKTRTRLAIVATAVIIAMMLGALPALAHGRSKHRDGSNKPAKRHACVLKGHTRGDLDGDGLKNLDEFRTRTNPRCADSDKDGINDGLEDPDGDGLVNVAEIASRTKPYRADSDKDGISDADEDADGDLLSNVQEYQCKTKPCRADSDKDGISDADEDADEDGLANGAEFAQGCDPQDSDSDDDGVLDGDEAVEGTVEEPAETPAPVYLMQADGTTVLDGGLAPVQTETAIAMVDWYDQDQGRLALMATGASCDYQVLVSEKTEFAWAASVTLTRAPNLCDFVEGATVTELEITYTADGELLAKKIVLTPSPDAGATD